MGSPLNPWHVTLKKSSTDARWASWATGMISFMVHWSGGVLETKLSITSNPMIRKSRRSMSTIPTKGWLQSSSSATRDPPLSLGIMGNPERRAKSRPTEPLFLGCLGLLIPNLPRSAASAFISMEQVQLTRKASVRKQKFRAGLPWKQKSSSGSGSVYSIIFINWNKNPTINNQKSLSFCSIRIRK